MTLLVARRAVTRRRRPGRRIALSRPALAGIALARPALAGMALTRVARPGRPAGVWPRTGSGRSGYGPGGGCDM
ncbi:hypothetical protein GCM10010210_51890 [Pseudonocardia hydrocarbonoxydans]|uniref:Uncharacterized protein n=1 Tax=Pseudonocardia hydrocarbonoxydans TaxID=76726 RepID=A0A4Y3WRU1_9PSEU|nr:hypothetical protein PHY01_27920 [Pseudonocardia hydrocarbonoxydans]